MTRARDIDPRLLRAFTAVAEELHFTRAAARLFVAQQALSRDIRRLERELGADLFVRSTRQVTLTEDGHRLLPHARRVLASHDELAAAFVRDERPLIVDAGGAKVGTSYRLLQETRRRYPDLEFVARFHTGLTGAAPDILSGRLDVSFGRVAGLAPEILSRLDHCPIRYEPLAVLLPEDHPLAVRSEIPLSSLAGETLYAAAGNPSTEEWTDLARRLFEGRGIRMAEPFPEIEGEEEFVRVVRKRGWSVLASVEFIEMDGMVLRPIVDPVPLSPISMVWRRGLRHRGLDALRGTAGEIGVGEGWLKRPPGSWLPEPDARLARDA
ncbi:LysR family transcriptional regulator [Streptomyces sp. SAJ15]|uniref:LysR family transcriptional regulator n=1 Tax=Streptomyces sp. SAJ15 TaxID=2011095 RepID=UPI0011867167|nr:LysR family transcriptional regulator [Streptomyces sp. SAJ15]TVL89130.1 LysR family transcriptional regulator [Streptomyces sp. SAJ15]